MKLKCIGGELDGQEHELGRYRFKEGEIISIRKPLNLSVTDRLDDQLTITNIDYVNYRIMSWHYMSHVRYILIPPDWTPIDAIDCLISRYAAT